MLMLRGIVISAVGGKIWPPIPTHRVNSRPRVIPTSPPCKVNTAAGKYLLNAFTVLVLGRESKKVDLTVELDVRNSMPNR